MGEDSVGLHDLEEVDTHPPGGLLADDREPVTGVPREGALEHHVETHRPSARFADCRCGRPASPPHREVGLCQKASTTQFRVREVRSGCT